MATYKPLTGKSYLQGNKSWYVVEGEITKEDVEKLNNLTKNCFFFSQSPTYL